MNPNLPADLYPYATADGKSIPLECLRPQGLTIKSLTKNSSSFTIPEDSETVLLYSTKDCLIRFGAACIEPRLCRNEGNRRAVRRSPSADSRDSELILEVPLFSEFLNYE